MTKSFSELNTVELKFGSLENNLTVHKRAKIEWMRLSLVTHYLYL